jgi:hypothetical protein
MAYMTFLDLQSIHVFTSHFLSFLKVIVFPGIITLHVPHLGCSQLVTVRASSWFRSSLEVNSALVKYHFRFFGWCLLIIKLVLSNIDFICSELLRNCMSCFNLLVICGFFGLWVMTSGRGKFVSVFLFFVIVLRRTISFTH